MEKVSVGEVLLELSKVYKITMEKKLSEIPKSEKLADLLKWGIFPKN
ncbi:MAG TPA: hypothetical protein HA346_02750 [Thermoplasmata archaeon]|nr:hypothetical protein [Thermoplasmata archaeon]